MRPGYLFSLILLIGLVGCQKTTVFRSSNMAPLGPLRLEFHAQPRDSSIEQVIENRLFCSNCLFTRSKDSSDRHSLIVEYRNLTDAASLGKMLLSGGMASIEDARVTYTLQIRFLTGGVLVKEYSYSAVSREKVVGGMECLLNPFCDENGKAVYVRDATFAGKMYFTGRGLLWRLWYVTGTFCYIIVTVFLAKEAHFPVLVAIIVYLNILAPVLAFAAHWLHNDSIEPGSNRFFATTSGLRAFSRSWWIRKSSGRKPERGFTLTPRKNCLRSSGGEICTLYARKS